ncbi:MAG TPA: hypothetical protein HPP77_08915 [Candidatus Hydrogenedentes bacterium]|nr:hypothetical protein [Candidatus Hydrogenedentota bacterium]
MKAMGERLTVDPATKRLLIFLFAVLAVLIAVAAFYHIRTWYYERQLVQLARTLVDEANENDPLPMPEEGPEADVEVKVNCSFDYLIFGPKTGKISLLIKPRAHAPKTYIGGVSYVYRHIDGEWQLEESYHE